MCRYFFTVFLLTLPFIALNGCKDEERCSMNTQCGNEHLCRDGDCLPKCQTYLTCAEGEACVEGACQIPAADFCSHIAPLHVPEVGPYEPCAPTTMSDAGVGGAMSGGMSAMGGQPMSGGEVSAPTTAGEAIAGGTTAGGTTAGGTTAGASAPAGEDTPAGAMSAAGSDTEGGATGGDASIENSAGEVPVLEVVGGESEAGDASE